MSKGFLEDIIKRLKENKLDTMEDLENKVDIIPNSLDDILYEIGNPEVITDSEFETLLDPKEREALLIWLNRNNIPQA